MSNQKTVSSFWQKIFRLDSNYYAFISGIVISISIELFVSIFSDKSLPLLWNILVLVSLFTLVSSIFFSVMAWKLDSIENQAITTSSTSRLLEEEPLWRDLILQNYTKLRLYFVLALFTLVLGLGLLPARLVLIQEHSRSCVISEELIDDIDTECNDKHLKESQGDTPSQTNDENDK